MQQLYVIEAKDFSMDMDDALEACGAKVFDIDYAATQDFLEFPMSLSAEETRDFSQNELEAYLILRSHFLYLLAEPSGELPEIPEAVLLANFTQE